MPRKISEKEGMVEVTKTTMKAGEKLGGKEKKAKIKIRPFVTETANVSVKYGYTLPMGDYASARMDVMISMPCYVEEVPDMYDKLRKMVDDLVSSEMDKVTGGADGKKKG